MQRTFDLGHKSIWQDIHLFTWKLVASPHPKSAALDGCWLQYTAVHSLSYIWLFVTPWPAARQASLSITNSRSLLKLMSFESGMPPNHLILCRPLLLLPSIFPSIRVFSNESVLHIRWPSTRAPASASVLPMNIQDWFPWRLTGLIS